MSVDKFNSEGYYDPTAYEAMSTVEKEERALRAFRPIVYICSPYAGETEKNVKAAQKYSRFSVEKGYIPICRPASRATMISALIGRGCWTLILNVGRNTDERK